MWTSNLPAIHQPHLRPAEATPRVPAAPARDLPPQIAAMAERIWKQAGEPTPHRVVSLTLVGGDCVQATREAAAFLCARHVTAIAKGPFLVVTNVAELRRLLSAYGLKDVNMSVNSLRFEYPRPPSLPGPAHGIESPRPLPPAPPSSPAFDRLALETLDRASQGVTPPPPPPTPSPGPMPKQAPGAPDAQSTAASGGKATRARHRLALAAYAAIARPASRASATTSEPLWSSASGGPSSSASLGAATTSGSALYASSWSEGQPEPQVRTASSTASAAAALQSAAYAALSDRRDLSPAAAQPSAHAQTIERARALADTKARITELRAALARNQAASELALGRYANLRDEVDRWLLSSEHDGPEPA